MCLAYRSLLFILIALSSQKLMAIDDHGGPITLSIEPQEAYIETRGSEQRLNFDLLLHNPGEQPLRINKIEISVYDAHSVLAFRLRVTV